MLGYARILPATNQFEYNPYTNRKELVEFCQLHNIVPVAYHVLYRPPKTPLFPFQKDILDELIVVDIAQKYGKTAAQVLLQWCLMRKCAFVVKSITPARIAENWESQFFKLEDEDFQKIDGIPYQGLYLDPLVLLGINIFN